MCQLPAHVIAISIATMLKRFFLPHLLFSAYFCLDFLGGFLDVNAFNHFVLLSIFRISLDDFSEQKIFNLRYGAR